MAESSKLSEGFALQAGVADRSGLTVYPNPSRAAGHAATIALRLADAAEVSVGVYDVLGRRVALLHVGALPAGEHAFAFDTGRLPSGLYLVRAEGFEADLHQRVTIVR